MVHYIGLVIGNKILDKVSNSFGIQNLDVANLVYLGERRHKKASMKNDDSCARK